jgi:hypothetical protein
VPHTPTRPHAAAGLLLAASTILVLLAFTLHPDESGATPAAILAAIARGRTQAHLVHGAMLAAFAAYAAAFTEYAVMLGSGRPWNRSALIIYLAGTALILPAIVIDGFVTPGLAAHILAAHILAGTPATMPIGEELMHVAGSLTVHLIEAGFVLIAAAIALWAILQLRQPAAARIPPAIAIATAALAIALSLEQNPFIPARILRR